MARVLIADDHADSREVMQAVLQSAGHETYLAADGDEALRLYRAHRPSLVILDILMPGKDGTEVIAELRGKSADVKILAISAAAGTGLLRAKLLGADLTLRKPIGADQLVRAVEQLLEQR